MKKIGRQVHFIPALDNNTRNGEGSFISLKDDTVMFAYTEFIGESRDDEENARISAIFSYDSGESWTKKKILFEKSESSVNVMSVSLLRMNNCDIGAFYIEKNADGTDKILFCRSADDGDTWSFPINCLECLNRQDYYILNNDRVIKLKNGRILLAVARHTVYTETPDFPPGEIAFIYSDDDGNSWHKTSTELKCPFKSDANGFQEPGLFERENGVIWCYIRTGLGFQFQCFSCDNGETWTEPEPNNFFSSPCSPMLVKKCNNLTFAVFNPVPEHILRDDEKEFWGRTPYTLAVSTDDGKSFSKKNLFYIEDDLNNGYCYPAVFGNEEYLLIAYYHSNNTDCCLNSTKITKVLYSEIQL